MKKKLTTICLLLIIFSLSMFIPVYSANATEDNVFTKSFTDKQATHYVCYVNVEGARVRAKPTTKSTIKGLLYPKNGKVVIDKWVEADNRLWGHIIKSQTGVTGWISDECLSEY